MPMPPMPTKWTRRVLRAMPAATLTRGAAISALPPRRELEAGVDDLARGLGTACAARGALHARDALAIGDERLDLLGEARAVEVLLEHHDRRAGVHHRARVELLVVVRGVR